MTDCCICLFGSDNRMKWLGELFYSAGFEVCSDFDKALNGDILILPPNVFELPQNYESYKKIFGGNVKNPPCNASFYNYVKNENFTALNALLTAKGLIQIMEADGIALEKSKALVAGYGYCGKAIAEELKKKGADIYVMVRRRELKRDIIKSGFGFVDMNDACADVISRLDLVANTAPALIFDRKMLDILSNNVKIYDIASAPGGVDFKYCEEKNIKAGIYLSIPGKMYPKEAAKAIYDTIINDIVE